MSIKCRNYTIFCSAKNTFLQCKAFFFFAKGFVPKGSRNLIFSSLCWSQWSDTLHSMFNYFFGKNFQYQYRKTHLVYALTDLWTLSQQSFNMGCSIWTWLDTNTIFYLAFNLNVTFCKTIKIFILKTWSKWIYRETELKKKEGGRNWV